MKTMGRGVMALVAVVLTGSAVAKIAHVPKVIEGLTHSGIPEGAILPIGILELSCLILYLAPRTGTFGTLLLTGYLGGATVTHLIGRQNLAAPLVVGALVWVGAYLRASRAGQAAGPALQTAVPAEADAPETRGAGVGRRGEGGVEHSVEGVFEGELRRK
jgi:hypothetical protein